MNGASTKDTADGSRVIGRSGKTGRIIDKTKKGSKIENQKWPGLGSEKQVDRINF